MGKEWSGVDGWPGREEAQRRAIRQAPAERILFAQTGCNYWTAEMCARASPSPTATRTTRQSIVHDALVRLVRRVTRLCYGRGWLPVILLLSLLFFSGGVGTRVTRLRVSNTRQAGSPLQHSLLPANTFPHTLMLKWRCYSTAMEKLDGRENHLLSPWTIPQNPA